MKIQNVELIPLLDTLRLEKISDDEYFSAKYSNYISNSRLSLLDNPEQFFKGFNKIYSGSLSIGSAVHEICLQNEFFELAPDLSKPTSKLGFVADYIYEKSNASLKPDVQFLKDASQEIDYYSKGLSDSRIEKIYEGCTPYWKKRKAFENDYNNAKSLIFLDGKSIDIVTNCINSVSNNQSIQNLLHPIGIFEDPISENEQAILLDVLAKLPNGDSHVLKLKAKLDNYTINENVITVNDIKTIGKILPEFSNSIERYHYNREIAIYAWLLSLCAKKFYNMDNPIVKGNYLVVSTIPSYYSKVVPMTSQMFASGWNEFKDKLRLVAYYLSNGYSWTN